MAIYYINKFNSSGGIYPYTRPEYGAKNFYDLVKNPSTKIDLKHGDQIRLYNPCPSSSCVIDDSSYDIEFDKEVYILSDSPNNGVIVKLKDDGFGLKFNKNSSKSKINGIKFTKANFDGGSMIYAENSISLLISDCEFFTYTLTSDSAAINLNKCQHSYICDCFIMVPNGFGINLEECNSCKIQGNSLNLNNLSNVAINFSSYVESYGNYIGSNVIYNMEDGSVGIQFDGYFNKQDVMYNVIRLNGSNTYGIISSIPVGHGKDINIKNNIFIYEEDDSLLYGIYIPDFGINNTSKYTITNNIFYNVNSSDIENALGMYISVNLNSSIVNYNIFYKFKSDYKYFWGGNPNTLSAMGERTYTEIDPQLLYYYDESPSLPYDLSAVESYLCSASSQALGAGQYHQHIGLFNQQNSFGYGYTNFIDTVTHDIGKIKLQFVGSFFTFFNSTFTESIETINGNYNKYYTSGDNYENQFSWESSAADDFPFTNKNDLYNKELIYVIKNKDKLEPFDGIFCPANPGYNFSVYSGYETGLFGFSREDYINTCITEPCIIQDDIDSEYLWIDEINASYIIQDSINPSCVGAES